MNPPWLSGIKPRGVPSIPAVPAEEDSLPTFPFLPLPSPFLPCVTARDVCVCVCVCVCV